MEEYKRKRISEIATQKVRPKYGSLVELHTYDYMETVQEAHPNVVIIVHVYQPVRRITFCKFLFHRDLPYVPD